MFPDAGHCENSPDLPQSLKVPAHTTVHRITCSLSPTNATPPQALSVMRVFSGKCLAQKKSLPSKLAVSDICIDLHNTPTAFDSGRPAAVATSAGGQAAAATPSTARAGSTPVGAQHATPTLA
jgi:hypothetical protein